ncbi:hypothetical protein, partial [Streptomyces sp. NPDC047968]|uniref:hypothetical protein n=1 Tax=Streptomyces sp. NPDC047968 TaxID=3155382 RepID=UPI003434667C
DFDWDVVPALFTRAEKELNVTDATSRYLLVERNTGGGPRCRAAHGTAVRSRAPVGVNFLVPTRVPPHLSPVERGMKKRSLLAVMSLATGAVIAAVSPPPAAQTGSLDEARHTGDTLSRVDDATGDIEETVHTAVHAATDRLA